MIDKPNWLMIGAAGRDVGKTEFACALISAQSKHRDVYGVKITTIKAQDGKCPRGGAGCGVCTSFGDAHWIITEETNSLGSKDTHRMLQAGATKVLWLRVHQDYLTQGIGLLSNQLPANAPVVCESNSARKALLPGLFLVISDSRSNRVKSSCQAVISFADKQILFEGNGWNMEPDVIGFDKKWVCNNEVHHGSRQR